MTLDRPPAEMSRRTPFVRPMLLRLLLLLAPTARSSHPPDVPSSHEHHHEHGCARGPPLSSAPWTAKELAATRSCLANRTIMVLGNSVARHFAFVLSDVLTGEKTEPVTLEILADRRPSAG